MSDVRSRTASTRHKQPTPGHIDALADEAVQNTGAVTLQERVRRRNLALKALAEGRRHMTAAEGQVSDVERSILGFLGTNGDCEDVSTTLRDAI